MKLKFSTATLQDAEEITKLVNLGYRGEASKAGWTSEADLLGGQRTELKKIQTMISQENSVIFIARDTDTPAPGAETGKLVACIYLKKDGPTMGYFGMLTVDPTLQAGGVGKIMMSEGERIVKEWGCLQMRIVVLRQREELIAFYERRGYRKSGVSEPFDMNDPRFDGQPKVEGLRLDEMVKLLA